MTADSFLIYFTIVRCWCYIEYRTASLWCWLPVVTENLHPVCAASTTLLSILQDCRVSARPTLLCALLSQDKGQIFLPSSYHCGIVAFLKKPKHSARMHACFAAFPQLSWDASQGARLVRSPPTAALRRLCFVHVAAHLVCLFLGMLLACFLVRMFPVIHSFRLCRRFQVLQKLFLICARSFAVCLVLFTVL